MMTGNKGEWSEIYAFLKILNDKRIYSYDDELTYGEYFLDVLAVYRVGIDNEEYTYSIENEKVFVSSKQDKKEISSVDLANYSKIIYHTIMDTKARSFSISDVEQFLLDVKVDRLKAPSKDKTDILLLVRDPKSNFTYKTGFSIKSFLGSNPTLINSSKPTNFKFELLGLSENDLKEANNIYSQQDRMDYIFKHIKEFKMLGPDNITSKYNILVLDKMYEKIISLLLWYSFKEHTQDLKELCQILDEKNPLEMKPGYYELKVKKLLITAALGFNFGSLWNGKEDANGGFINVLADGNLSVVHFFNRNNVENALFNSTRLERGSRKKHDYGFIFEENGKYYLNLNFAVRYK